MKYNMVLLVAELSINEFMASCDMKATNKWFVKLMDMEFSYEKQLTPEFFFNLINKSKSNKSFNIIGIKFCETIYVQDEVDIISDGTNIIYMRAKTDDN